MNCDSQEAERVLVPRERNPLLHLIGEAVGGDFSAYDIDDRAQWLRVTTFDGEDHWLQLHKGLPPGVDE